jgi:hypothetical protein
MEAILEFFGIYFLCWFKFIAGPILGSVAGYNLLSTVLVTVLGMMSSVFIFTFAGQKVKKYLNLKYSRPKLKFTRKNRQIITIWKKYGEIGIAFLTPLVLTPIGGTLIMISFGVKKRRIFSQMFLSSVFWALLFSLSVEWIMAFPLFSNLFT